jgi:hypothetical protein
MIAEAVSPATTVTIYALVDPDSDEVRYVGRTTNNPWQRYSQHLMGTGNATKAWIRGLRPEHKVPALKILEESVSVEASSRERYWIEYWRSQGAQLLNYACQPKCANPEAPIIQGPSGSLSALLIKHGITTIREFAHRMGFKRQQAWEPR